MEPIVYLDSALWRDPPARGVTPPAQFLTPGNGRYCALGLYFKAKGVGDIALAACGFPEELAQRWGVEVPEGLIGRPGVAIMEASDAEQRDNGVKMAIALALEAATGEKIRWTQ